MIKCEICEKELKNKNSLSKHIKVHNITLKDYYDKFLKKDPSEGICKECGNPTKYVSFSEGYRKYCGNPCPTNMEVGRTWKNATKRKYGVDNVSQLDEIKEKKRQTFQKNYNKDNIFQTDEFKEKMKSKDWSTRTEKIQQTFQDKYNGHPMYDPEIKERSKQTFRQNYEVDNPLKVPEIRQKVFQTFFQKTFKPKLEIFLQKRNLSLVGEYKGSHLRHVFKCNICNTEFDGIWSFLQQGFYSCPTCNPKFNGTSKPEKEIYEFLLQHFPEEEIQTNCKNIIKNPNTNRHLELDIYLPNKQIAIEFNGLYWHSDEIQPDPNYHLIKTEQCEKQNIQLIHIFEDEWFFNQEIVEHRLLQILGKSTSIKIHARQCIIREIDPKTKNEFLEKYHIQGKDAAKIKLGAFYNDELVAVMTFSKGNIAKGSKALPGVWELNRFCSNYNYHIPGIASKLLEHFKRNYEWIKIFSYADRRWSTGNLYFKLGFIQEQITKPNYWYVKDFIRLHRFNLRKRIDEPKEIPEWLLRLEEGYVKVWDCGNLKFQIQK